MQARHNEIQRIEKTITELAALFNEMEQLVTEQDTMVQNIDQRGEEITENVAKAEQELEGAVEKARSARRKKWWCLLIVRKFDLHFLALHFAFGSFFSFSSFLSFFPFLFFFACLIPMRDRFSLSPKWDNDKGRDSSLLPSEQFSFSVSSPQSSR